MSYDTAITVFSPDGHLFQVEYAAEAVKKGKCLVGVRGGDCVVYAVEKKSSANLEDTRTHRKIIPVDQSIILSFSGLSADARVLSDQAIFEAQSYRYNFDAAPTIEYITRFIAREQQRFTQRSGVRPYGVSMLIGGFDGDGKPRLFMTEPSGSCTEWVAATIGRNDKVVREYLEKNFGENLSEAETLKLAVQGLLEVVEPDPNCMEISILRGAGIETLTNEKIQEVINAAKEE